MAYPPPESSYTEFPNFSILNFKLNQLQMERQIFNMIPGVDPEEINFLKQMASELREDQVNTFLQIYVGRRIKPDNILIGALVGLLGIGGVQRFMVNQIGMGILFLLTAGLCYIGTIVDIVNYKKLALEENQNKAYEALQMARSMN